MTNIDRLPHPLFAAFWLLRYLAILAFIFFFNPIGLFISVASFVPVEALALQQKTRFRDTLSEIWTYSLRKMQIDAENPLGWNLMAPIAAAIEVGALHVLLEYGGVFPSIWIYVITFLLFFILWFHWWRPQGIGTWWPKT